MARCERTGADPTGELAAHDAWLKERQAESCFLDPAYPLFQEHFYPPSLAGEVWQAYRRLAGDRTLIILPMGGAIPGAIPWFNSQHLLETYEIDPDDWEDWRSLWDTMDGLEREKAGKK